MDVAEEVLEALEIFAPGGGVFGEQAFEGVAKSFQADTELVPGFGLFAAQGAVVQLSGFFEALEGEAFSGEASHRDEADAAA